MKLLRPVLQAIRFFSEPTRSPGPGRSRPGRGVSTLIAKLAAACAALLAGAGALAQAPANYDELPGKKALAVAQGSSPVYGIAHSQPQDLLAAVGALMDCRQERGEAGPPCELIRLNERQITTARQLRDALPKGPRPLFLWRYASPNATLYLAGSIHLFKEALYPLPEPLEAAFQQADTLVVEVDFSAADPSRLQATMLSAGKLPKGQYLETVLPPETYERLSRRLASEGTDIDFQQRLKPALIVQTLTLTGAMALGYEATYGLEHHFIAKKGDRPVLELESIDAQLELLFGQPMATQIQLLDDTLDQTAELEPLLADMLRAWLAGADDELLRLFEQQAGDSDLVREFNRQLLDDRNVHMAAKTRKYLNGKGTYFVLVGAAHLVGENGIVSLLEKKGVTGTRIMSDATL